MYFNINTDQLLSNCVKFSLDLVKTNIKKTVSDRAVRAVKALVFRRNKRVNKTKSIHLNAGDCVTFVVRKHGLDQQVVDEGHHILVSDLMVTTPEMTTDDNGVHVCDHPSRESHQFCELCFKNQLKSKL
ncbi:unnamed protein product [Medioppia subpectinata]|uniref:Uncharacterized protein n=1 Tax=Medioppia subpectinata TaxID=1979941 RepID=A0A7R9L293_9ACAR|nr:unnamed protein product [Medioppia subpectinata]CAG2114192.1 unnamed protein product [Medioppia subpectinata]